jgi:hypothetical protein
MIFAGKHNKHMLTLFLVLLGAVIIISAFGGSIKTQEHFWEDITENKLKPEDPSKHNESLPTLPVPPTQTTNIPEINNSQIPTISPEISKKEDSKITIEPFQGSMFAGAY